MTIINQPDRPPAIADHTTPEQVERVLDDAYDLIGELYGVLDLAIAHGGDTVLDSVSWAASNFYGPTHTDRAGLADLNERTSQVRQDLDTQRILLDPVTAFTISDEN